MTGTKSASLCGHVTSGGGGRGAALLCLHPKLLLTRVVRVVAGGAGRLRRRVDRALHLHRRGALELVVALEAEVVRDLERGAGVRGVVALVAGLAGAHLVRSVRRGRLVLRDRRETARLR